MSPVLGFENLSDGGARVPKVLPSAELEGILFCRIRWAFFFIVGGLYSVTTLGSLCFCRFCRGKQVASYHLVATRWNGSRTGRPTQYACYLPGAKGGHAMPLSR